MRSFATLFAGALVCCLLAGCSGGDNDAPQPETPSPTPTVTATATTTAAAEPTAKAMATKPADEDEEWEKEPGEGARPWENPDGPRLIAIGEGERPATLLIPREADRSEPRPLVLLLHGYGSSGEGADTYFQFAAHVNELGFGLILPNGTEDPEGERFWNGTAECCDMLDTGVDDAGYLRGLIEEARAHAAFDKVFAVGHSNGGFMAYRLACEAIPGLTAIVSLAGGTYANADDCRAPSTVSVLQIHGERDLVIRYAGGPLKGPLGWTDSVPGAEESVLRWAERTGCDLNAAEELAPIDTDLFVEGAETSIQRWREGCAGGTVHELWTIRGGGHVPLVWGTEFTERILLWLNDAYTGEVTIEGDGVE
ncbi:MAG: hypothetical protein F4X03_02750 [Dehalococcoidia bacterium]|nr:hypothetical protein [Dehalococcoidia bacterium]MYD27822.1 hypothetical protein [Dehalococcoidia bacterium]